MPVALLTQPRMFGVYRTLLALLVVAHHLFAVPTVGRYAVHGFFVLSGFLMTYVMQKNYGYTLTGAGRFAKARALRLYPSWLAILVLAAIIIAVVGPESSDFRSPMFLPQNPIDWIQNATLVFADIFPNRVEPRLSPATWALTIELFYYALICFGISRNRTITWIWFAFGVAYHFWATGEDYTYFNIFSGSLPFSIGALIFHYRERLSFTVPYPYLWAFAGAGIIVPLAMLHAFYINMIVAALFVIVLMNVKQNPLDSRLGDYSYHMYIAHWPVGLAVYAALGYLSTGRMLLPFLLTLVACGTLSYLLTRFVDQPMTNRFKGPKPQPAP